MFSCIPTPSFIHMYSGTSQICFVGLIWNRLSGTAGDSSALRGSQPCGGRAQEWGHFNPGGKGHNGEKPLTRELFHYGDTLEGSEDHIQEDTEEPEGPEWTTLSWVLKGSAEVSQRNWKRAKLQFHPNHGQKQVKLHVHGSHIPCHNCTMHRLFPDAPVNICISQDLGMADVTTEMRRLT